MNRRPGRLPEPPHRSHSGVNPWPTASLRPPVPDRGGRAPPRAGPRSWSSPVVASGAIGRDLTDHSGQVERIGREARAAARLHHPNIAVAYDAEQAGPVHFLVTEFVEGADLARLVTRRGPLPVDVACDCARQVALGL